MRSRLLRAAIVLATFLVAWLVVTPAQAAAPLCDPRAAVGFAPPPQLQDADQSIDLGIDECASATPLEARRLAPGGGAPDPIVTFSSDDALAHAVLFALEPLAVRIAAPRACAERERIGIRSTIERPPRS